MELGNGTIHSRFRSRFRFRFRFRSRSLYSLGPIPAIRSKSSGAAHPAGFPLLSGVLAWFPMQIFHVNTPLKKPYFRRNYLLFLRQYLI